MEYTFSIQNFWETCACPEKQSWPVIFHCIEYTFYIQDFLATCACPEKQSCAGIYHCIEIYFIIQDFWATRACPEKQLSWNFSLYWIYFLHSGVLSNLRLPWKTDLRWNFSLYWNIFYHSRFLSNLRLPWKQSLPWNFSNPGGGWPPSTPALYAYAWLHLRPCLVPSWCGATRGIWDYCWSWSISGPPRAAARDSPQRRIGHKNKWVNEYVGLYWNFLFMKLSLVCFPNVNVVFKQLIMFGRKLAFLWKSVKRIRHRRENGVDTLKLHHDTLLKTLKKTLIYGATLVAVLPYVTVKCRNLGR